MAKKDNTKQSKKTKPKTAPERVDIHVDGNVEKGNILVGNNNVVNNYYQVVEQNTTPNDPDFWNLKHPYPMPPNFTGRLAERATLTQWLDGDSENRLFILRALGGFGKSALVWQWLTHDVNPKAWKKVVFWSFYEGNASFEGFTRETLEYLNIDVPQGGRPQVDELLKAMQRDNILLIMDGFERVLRMYASMNAAYQGDEGKYFEEDQLDCKDINAEWLLKGVCSNPKIKSKVLMTTRHAPRAIKPRGEFVLGCREVELNSMQPADVVEFFHKQKIKGTHAEVKAACAPYGYHPLSLRILAGLITNDREKPSNITVADTLDITDDVIANQHHVLEVAYNTLSPQQQKLLSNIACFRSSVKYEALKIVSGIPSRKRNKTKVNPTERLGSSLQILEIRGLLQWNREENKYYLHPLVRRYAYKRFAESDRIATHTRLRNYFAAIDTSVKPQTIDELSPVIELYHHTVQAKKFDDAFELFEGRLVDPLYFQMSANQIVIELLHAFFPDGEDIPLHLAQEVNQGWILNTLAAAYSDNGQLNHAVTLYKLGIEIVENQDDRLNTSIGLASIAAAAYTPMGSLRRAEANIQRAISIAKDNEVEPFYIKASKYRDLGVILIYCGEWENSDQYLAKAEIIFKNGNHTQGQSTILAARVQRALLINRDSVYTSAENRKSGILFAQGSLEIAKKTSLTWQRFEREFIRAYWLLGAAYRVDGQLELAEQNLSEALQRERAVDLIEDEANILLDLARLRYDQNKYEEAKSLADEALLITKRCGYVLQGADVNLFLAQYALEQEKDKAKAKVYAEEAKKLATCDGPPYYYKVAYEEAEAMLEKLSK
jgi:tetratricopeptide (TPR) repeat protein